ncbi:MAG: GNAT family N-acetyltransferase [Leucobacter sp.]
MARYLTEEAAAAADIHIEHEPDKNRFAVYEGEGKSRTARGEAHYTFLSETGINFDHTFVDPALRGTGISGILAHRALTSPVVAGRKIEASCWFIAGYLRKHPELATSGEAAADGESDPDRDQPGE